MPLTFVSLIKYHTHLPNHAIAILSQKKILLQCIVKLFLSKLLKRSIPSHYKFKGRIFNPQSYLRLHKSTARRWHYIIVWCIESLSTGSLNSDGPDCWRENTGVEYGHPMMLKMGSCHPTVCRADFQKHWPRCQTKPSHLHTDIGLTQMNTSSFMLCNSVTFNVTKKVSMSEGCCTIKHPDLDL